MATIYVLKQGLTLTRRNNRILIRSGRKVENSYPEMDVDKIVIFGNVNLTPQLMEFLLANNIETIFISSRGKYRGRLRGHLSKNVLLRLRQFEVHKDREFVVNVSRRIVYGKLKNCLALARRINWDRKSKRVKRIIPQLRREIRMVEFQEDLEKLRGIEGAGTNMYFNMLREFVKNELFYFSERNKRPPEDPANAVLSFLYTLLYQLVESAIYSVGLDPFVGFFHTVEYGKPALALDLMEEFRPVMDRVFLRLVNRGMLKLADFRFVQIENKEKYGVFLSSDGLKKVVAGFQQEIEKDYFYTKLDKGCPLRDIVFEQARNMVRAIKGEEDYKPFELEL